jgi:hypothetical protein
MVKTAAFCSELELNTSAKSMARLLLRPRSIGGNRAGAM